MRNCKKELAKMRNIDRMKFVKGVKETVTNKKLVTTRDMAWIVAELSGEEKEWIMELAKFAGVPF